MWRSCEADADLALKPLFTVSSALNATGDMAVCYSQFHGCA